MVSLSDSIVSEIGDEPGEAASLVARAANGDHMAWNALVDLYAGTVWAVARGHGLGAADAAEVSRTTWLRMADHLHCIEAPEQVGAWMATTARRESLRLLRLTGG
jgi:DNA-directed RNA polymerase specialized sigma24 family protein